MNFSHTLQMRHSRAALPVLERGPWLLIIILGDSGGLHDLFWDHTALITGDILFQTQDAFELRGPQLSCMRKGINKNPESALHCFLVAYLIFKHSIISLLLLNELV